MRGVGVSLQNPSFRVSAALNVVTLTLVLVAAVVVPAAPLDSGTLLDRVAQKFNATRHVDGSRQQATGGYYEDLFEQSSRAVAVNGLISGAWETNWTTWEFTHIRRTTTRQRGDFLYFDLLPNLDVPELNGRLVTNSFGMADKEYARARRPGIRRAAFIGDSMTRGLGSTPGHNYEARLEDTLNESLPVPGVNGYEFLNFGVEGYRLTQMVEVANVKVTEFSPDCYVIVLSDLGVARRWADHLWQLVSSGIDLKYAFLEQVVRDARLRPSDDPVTMEIKLAPYRMAVIRWALLTIKETASDSGADTLAVMVPQVIDPAGQAEAFQGIPELLAELDIPVIDALDAFVGIDDPVSYRTSPGDTHPSDLGHEVLAAKMLERARANPEAWRMLAGTAPTENFVARTN